MAVPTEITAATFRSGRRALLTRDIGTDCHAPTGARSWPRVGPDTLGTRVTNRYEVATSEAVCPRSPSARPPEELGPRRRSPARRRCGPPLVEAGPATGGVRLSRAMALSVMENLWRSPCRPWTGPGRDGGEADHAQRRGKSAMASAVLTTGGTPGTWLEVGLDLNGAVTSSTMHSRSGPSLRHTSWSRTREGAPRRTPWMGSHCQPGPAWTWPQTISGGPGWTPARQTAWDVGDDLGEGEGRSGQVRA